MNNIQSKADAVEHWLKFGFAVDTANSDSRHWSSGWTSETSPEEIQTHFEQYPTEVPAAVLPDAVIAFQCNAQDDKLTDYLKTLPVPPAGWYPKLALYRLSADSQLPRSPVMPGYVSLKKSGDLVRLPYGADLNEAKVSAKVISELSEVAGEFFADKKPEPPRRKLNLLAPYSMRGRTDDIRNQIVEEKPILGQLALNGQITLWFGPTNAGKTLIFFALLGEAMAEKIIEADQIYYVNADDNGKGLLTKTELMDDLGCHTIAPGYAGFETGKLDELLTSMAANGQAKGLFVILDTAKKFVDPMSKKDTARFADICRRFALKGGTMLVLAHTNKNPGNNGKQQYAGTADLPQDFDAAYTMDVLADNADEKVVMFSKLKGRGDSASSAAYAFNNRNDLSYAERLASVTLVDPDQVDNFKRIADQAKDADVIDALKDAMQDGTMSKMELAKHVSGQVSAGRNAVIKIIEQYEGRDPAAHLWYFETGARGRKTYSLHETPSDAQAPAD